MSDFLEKTLEDIVYENRYRIYKRGFIDFYFCTERQFTLPSGARMDLFTWELRGEVLFCKIIELKKERVTADSLWQILRYYDEIFFGLYKQFSGLKIDLVLVGNGITDNIDSVSTLIPQLSVYEYKYNFDGISFFKTNFFSEDELKRINHEQPYREPNESTLPLARHLREAIYKKQEFQNKHPEITRNKSKEKI